MHTRLRLLLLLAGLVFANSGGWACVSLPALPKWVDRYEPSKERYRTNKHGAKIPSSCEGILIELYFRLHPLDREVLKGMSREDKEKIRFERLLLGHYEIEKSETFEATCPFSNAAFLGYWFLDRLQGLVRFDLPSSFSPRSLSSLKKKPMFCKAIALQWKREKEEWERKEKVKKMENEKQEECLRRVRNARQKARQQAQRRGSEDRIILHKKHWNEPCVLVRRIQEPYEVEEACAEAFPPLCYLCTNKDYARENPF